MNYLTVTGLLIFVTSLFCSFVVFFSKPLSILKSTWGLFSLAVGIWGFGLYMAYSASEYASALVWLRILNLSAITIPVFFVNFVILFSNKFTKKIKEVKIYYVVAILIICLSVVKPDYFIPSLSAKVGFNFYPNPGVLYYLFFLLFCYLVAYGVFLLIKIIEKASPIQVIQAKYILFGTAIGFLGGSTTFFPVFNIPIFPFGTCLVIIYVISITYAIAQYRLMDIKLVVSLFAIFIGVYALVLAIPCYLYAVGIKFIAFVSGIIFASAGPFIYIFLKNKAEDKLLQESRRIQQVLIKFSIGLSSVRELKKLIRLIINALGGSLGLDFAGVFLLDQGSNEYTLKLSEPVLKDEVRVKPDHPLFARLLDKRGPLLLDELKYELDNEKGQETAELKSIIDLFQSLNGALIIPAIKEDLILAFVVLGETRVEEIHSREFLDVLTVVGNQIALAIESAVFYEETNKDWSQRAHESRIKTMGAMSTGIAHQIRNRLNAITTQALGLKDLLSFVDSSKITPEIFEDIKKEYEETIERIFKNIKKCEEICDGIKNYAKKKEDKPQIVKFDETIKGAMKLVELARKNVNFTLVEENTEEIILWTNFAMLEDILFNMFDNSNDAIASRKEAIEAGEMERPVDGFKVNVHANLNGKMCEIVVEDNGKGILPEHLKEDSGVNVMWFTTKGYQKGTGMGIPMMREFVKFNGGTFNIESEYGKWTKITFTLPLATEEQKKSGENAA